MQLTIVYDNEVYSEGLEADWGFSCLIESHGRYLLFDTGTKADILLRNMQSLSIEPDTIDDIFISHDHYDHTGGLTELLSRKQDMRVFAPSTMSGIAPAGDVIYVDKPMKLADGLYTTGLLKDIEHSLAIESGDGLVVVAGCSHPGVRSILDASRKFGNPWALIGGLHGFDEFEVLEELNLVCPTHCTQHIAEIRSKYPVKIVQGGAGRVIDLPE